MNEQQLTVCQARHVVHPTDDIAEAGEGMGTVMIVARDADPRLFQRQASDPLRFGRLCRRIKQAEDDKDGKDQRRRHTDFIGTGAFQNTSGVCLFSSTR